MLPIEIKNKRIGLAMSQELLAHRLGVSFATVNRWEKGSSKPTNRNLILLKKIFDEYDKSSSKENIENHSFRPIQYLGSKKRLLDEIYKILDEITPRNGIVCDIFSGSGVVTQFLSKKFNTISVDIQNYSTILTSSLIDNHNNIKEINKFIDDIYLESEYIKQKTIFKELINYEEYCLNEAKDGNPDLLIEFVENISLYKNYIYNNKIVITNNKLKKIVRDLKSYIKKDKKKFNITLYYGGVYFSVKQALMIDYILNKIKNSKLDKKEKDFFRGILLSVSSHIVNTVGKQFAQPIKLVNKEGNPKKLLVSRTIRDRRYDVFEVFKEWGIKYVKNQNISNYRHKFYSMGYDDFLNEYNGKIDCFYADPPYTIDHYSRFYHVLETIVLYDFPKLMEKSLNGEMTLMNGLYREDRHQSPFSIKSKVKEAFEKLLKGALSFNAPIILSYSPSNTDSNGRSRLLEIEEILDIAKTFYPFVELINVDSHVHRKLNSKQNNNISFENAEVFIVCTLKEVKWKNI